MTRYEQQNAKRDAGLLRLVHVVIFLGGASFGALLTGLGLWWSRYL